jgi:hypothetical protein
LVACASGGDTDDGDLTIGLGDGSPPASTGEEDMEPTSADDSDTKTTAMSVDDSGDDGPDDTTTGADPSTTGGIDDTGDDTSSGMMCVNAATCPTAMSIGGVAGDEGSPDLSASGDAPTWLKFQVAENSSSVIGENLSFTATLISPPGTDYDLFVFRGPPGGASGCGGAQGSSANAGSSDSVSMDWGEGGVANNADDGTTIAVEIRAKADMCMPGVEWTLTVEGDTN